MHSPTCNFYQQKFSLRDCITVTCTGRRSRPQTPKSDFDVEGGVQSVLVCLNVLETSTKRKHIIVSHVAFFRFFLQVTSLLLSWPTLGAMAESSSSSSASGDDNDDSSGDELSVFVPSQQSPQAVERKRKKHRTGADGGPADDDVADGGGEGDGGSDPDADEITQPAPADVALREHVLAMTASAVPVLVDTISAACVRYGYPKLNQKEIRSTRAYFFCWLQGQGLLQGGYTNQEEGCRLGLLC